MVSAGTLASGMRRVNVEPSPSSLNTVTDPPLAAARGLTPARPAGEERDQQRHRPGPVGPDVQEVDALARASGSLEAVAWYGGLDMDVAIDDPEQAWRMVAVLQKPIG